MKILNRDTFLGNFTNYRWNDNVIMLRYIYTGFRAQYKIGALNITPSFTPGLYHEGDGKDLGTCLNLKVKFNFIRFSHKVRIRFFL